MKYKNSFKMILRDCSYSRRLNTPILNLCHLKETLPIPSLTGQPSLSPLKHFLPSSPSQRPRRSRQSAGGGGGRPSRGLGVGGRPSISRIIMSIGRWLRPMRRGCDQRQVCFIYTIRLTPRGAAGPAGGHPTCPPGPAADDPRAGGSGARGQLADTRLSWQVSDHAVKPPDSGRQD